MITYHCTSEVKISRVFWNFVFNPQVSSRDSAPLKKNVGISESREARLDTKKFKEVKT